ncbi:MAG: HRDC domain-containing protein [Holosporaceae bacterium]|jgi:ribonuclease D|nr:HRDC domain-containing protein [Holosporaceae bacterium]
MRLIDSPEQSVGLGEIIRREVLESPPEGRFVAVDTEFIRENLESPLLCLVQLATPAENYVLDAVSLDLTFLKLIFEDDSIRKVFHSAEQDLEILLTYGFEIKNFYDVQLQEMLLSPREKVSYQSIVFKYLGKRLKKGYSLSDWGKRPLSPEQLRYSAEDVIHLREVYEKQVLELTHLGRLHWLEGDWNWLRKSKCEQAMFSHPRSEKSFSVFNQLMEWRSQKALEKNLHPEQIVRDETLRAICRRGMGFLQKMKNSRHRKSESLREFLLFAETIPDMEEIVEAPSERNTVLHLLKAVLETCSTRERIATSLLASTEELEQLSAGNRDLKCLEGWRHDVFGKYALALLDGEMALRLRDSRVELSWEA